MIGTVISLKVRQPWSDWKMWRPTELTRIPDPTEFFSGLDLQV
ncbi:hypothetical protein [Jatrophihabitans lederbergiae]|uniref:Uncharacterized protein n=1 Tax=Jatrophihabitans lederbergiae TaxID=3075547 RepID=A0ABU2JDJ9_9ACTN|nr:hypothetical protein [Jatrophihabitans sp. DSM 44399]MDT0262343.1 hypothetical protein [Jatrophihabitans sp. DSM 44399]